MNVVGELLGSSQYWDFSMIHYRLLILGLVYLCFLRFLDRCCMLWLCILLFLGYIPHTLISKYKSHISIGQKLLITMRYPNNLEQNLRIQYLQSIPNPLIPNLSLTHNNNHNNICQYFNKILHELFINLYRWIFC